MRKRTLVLGGTSGIGESLARIAATRGRHVTVAGRTAASCPLVQEGRAEPLTLDLGDPSAASAALKGSESFDEIFWSAGVLFQGAFEMMTPDELIQFHNVHLVGPSLVLGRAFRRAHGTEPARPLRLVTIASTTSWKSRGEEAVYSGVQAGKAQLTRSLARELAARFPAGSGALLVHPGGLRTPAWQKIRSDRDVSAFMDPALVAWIIWEEFDKQMEPFAEIHILREPDGTPRVERGPRPPE